MSESPLVNAAGIGAVYGAIQNLWLVPAQTETSIRLNVRSVGEAAIKNSLHFAMIGLVYTVGTSAAGAFRGSEDHLNSGIGGACVGAYTGLRQGGISALHGTMHRSIALAGAGMFCSFAASRANK